MNLKEIADGGSFDMAVAVRLLALKVGLLTGEIPANAVTMDAPEAGATLDSAAPVAKKGKAAKKEAEAE